MVFVTTDPKVVIRDIRGFVHGKGLDLLTAIFNNVTAPPSEGGTPIDTGFATSNWMPSEDTQFSGTVGSRDAVNRTAQHAALAALKASYRGGNLLLTNNVSYLPLLNTGHSKQAPRGFIQSAVRRAMVEVSKK